MADDHVCTVGTVSREPQLAEYSVLPPNNTTPPKPFTSNSKLLQSHNCRTMLGSHSTPVRRKGLHGAKLLSSSKVTPRNRFRSSTPSTPQSNNQPMSFENDTQLTIGRQQPDAWDRSDTHPRTEGQPRKDNRSHRHHAEKRTRVEETNIPGLQSPDNSSDGETRDPM